MNSEIAAVVDAISRLPRGVPPVIVFSNAAYTDILDNWLLHARAAGAESVVVVALDQATFDSVAAAGTVRALLPGIASHEQLWTMRAALFAALAGVGIDFIHSDADAVWLRSPVDEIFGLGVDVAFSGGTVWPYDVVTQWGFVLCCGLFGVRAGPAAGRFFAAVVDRMEIDRDDQAAVNRTLLRKGIAWREDGPCENRIWHERPFRVFQTPVIGNCMDLSVALLPHRRFPRLPEVSTETVVAHPLSPEAAGARIQELRRLGLWRLA